MKTDPAKGKGETVDKRKCPSSEEDASGKKHREECSCHSQEKRPKETTQSQGGDRGQG
jgi:hypothetical protein